MGSEIKYCKSCSETKKNMLGSQNQKNIEFGKGYIIGWDENIANCPFCNSALVDIDLSFDDYMTIRNVSNYNRQLLESMIDLHDKDIIEYELKMSQFRNQVEQRKTIQSQQQESNKLKCPTCHSTNIRKISETKKAASIIGFGILSNNLGKTYECLNCKYKW